MQEIGFRVDKGQVIFENPDGKDRATRPATNQETILWECLEEAIDAYEQWKSAYEGMAPNE